MNMKKIRYAAWLAGLISLMVLSQAGAEEKLPSEKREKVNQVFEAAEVQVTEGRSPIAEPYPYISTGSFSGPAVPESPDPLVAYRWPSPKATDGLEIYLLKPSAVSSDTAASFDNLGSLTTDHPNVTVNGAGSIRMDFGRESAAWLEFDSPDCSGDVEMSISEYSGTRRLRKLGFCQG